jgi:hypothetical protein
VRTPARVGVVLDGTCQGLELAEQRGRASRHSGSREGSDAAPLVNTRFAAVLALVVAFSVGCEPAHQLELTGTTWTIAAVGDQLLTESRTIAFLPENRAALVLTCGQIASSWYHDTDGDALQIGFERRAPCADPVGEDAAVLRALDAVDRWSFQDDSDITLSGTEQNVRLRRP